MTDLLTAHAADQPDQLAVLDGRGAGDVRTLTYAELEARSGKLAHVLLGPGVRAGWKGRGSNVCGCDV